VVTLRVGTARVTFDGSQWSGPDERLVRALELLTPRDQLSPSVGRPDLFVAKYMLPKLEDAEILDISPSTERDVGVVY
jgi:hypothetical protein